MMSNTNPGISDPMAGPGQGGHSSGQRNVQFRMSATQQQQLHQHHQQQQQPHDGPGVANITSKVQTSDPMSYGQQHQHQRSGSNLSQHGHPSHLQQQQYSHPPQSHGHYNSNSQAPGSNPQQHQQRPPIPPVNQPRLHHSASVGNISVSAIASRNGQGGGANGNPHTTGAGAGAAVMAPLKKKDPYATAWRTYSKIAEELQLLNPDGSLYPISKEAILKYLHHQSKRIKSSNLHWYVNGLKKHQENLGFPWDDVRYDEQVVSLLKELTLHPVMMMAENGDDGDGQHHGYGSQPNSHRQRQTSTGMYSSGRSGGGGHHYSSSSIDTTRIANLSISQQPPSHQSQQQHHHQAQQKHHSYGGTGLKQQHHGHQQYMQMHMQSQRIQQPPPPKPYYHIAPTQVPSHHARTPSAQDKAYPSAGGHHSSLSSSSQPQSPGVGMPLDTHGMRGGEQLIGNSASALTKRKRDDSGFKKRRGNTSMSIEGEDNEDDELQEEDLKDDDLDLDDRRAHDMDDFDDLEDSNRYQPLKRRASTGTLLNQAKAQAVKHIPGPFALDHSGASAHLYPKLHHVNSSSGSAAHGQRSDQTLRSPSPDMRDDELGHYSLGRVPEGLAGLRNSPPPDSIEEREESQRYQQMSSGGGIVTSPTTTATATDSTATPPSLSASGMTGAGGGPGSGAGAGAGAGTGASGKTTVHFSEVVECAQQLQAKYGNKCRDHPWGCVEITEDQHLELTIKMYLDWAGLVASGRLTMDELPDLAEFRMVHPVVGGTLRRMASTPFTGRALNASGGCVPSMPSSSHRLIATEYSSSSDSSRLNFGPYRSPSSSPPNHQLFHNKDLATEGSRLLARVGSPLPPPASAERSIPSSPPGVESSTSAGSGNSQNAGLFRGARRMQSTPTLGQLVRQGSVHSIQQHEVSAGYLQGHSRPNHGGSMAMNSSSTESSPRFEENKEPEEDVSFEDELEGEEDEEVVDVSNYALSPWATAPAAPSALPTRALRTMVRGGSEKSQEQRGRDSARSGGTTVDRPQIEKDDSAMAEDTEGTVDAIGEISDAPRPLARVSNAIIIVTNETATAATASEDNVSGDGREGNVVGRVNSSSVDAAAKGLNSMVIGSHLREDLRGRAAVEHYKLEGSEGEVCTKPDSGAIRENETSKLKQPANKATEGIDGQELAAYGKVLHGDTKDVVSLTENNQSLDREDRSRRLEREDSAMMEV